MRLQDLQEASPLTVAGSFMPGLMANKLWLCTELAKIKKDFTKIYVLGSWYGNISMVLNKLDYFTFDQIVNVDKNPAWQRTGQQISKQLGLDHDVRSISQDANRLKYKDLDRDSLIISNSCNDIDGDQWFKNIPTGTLVALQGRNNLPAAAREFDSLEDFKKCFLISNIEFEGEREFSDPETDYQLFMIIGRK